MGRPIREPLQSHRNRRCEVDAKHKFVWDRLMVLALSGRPFMTCCWIRVCWLQICWLLYAVDREYILLGSKSAIRPADLRWARPKVSRAQVSNRSARKRRAPRLSLDVRAVRAHTTAYPNECATWCGVLCDVRRSILFGLFYIGETNCKSCPRRTLPMVSANAYGHHKSRASS